MGYIKSCLYFYKLSSYISHLLLIKILIVRYYSI
nr:MAG TPA: hypothetical protein [Caudoviricetes sp.]